MSYSSKQTQKLRSTRIPDFVLCVKYASNKSPPAIINSRVELILEVKKTSLVGMRLRSAFNKLMHQVEEQAAHAFLEDLDLPRILAMGTIGSSWFYLEFERVPTTVAIQERHGSTRKRDPTFEPSSSPSPPPFNPRRVNQRSSELLKAPKFSRDSRALSPSTGKMNRRKKEGELPVTPEPQLPSAPGPRDRVWAQSIGFPDAILNNETADGGQFIDPASEEERGWVKRLVTRLDKIDCKIRDTYLNAPTRPGPPLQTSSIFEILMGMKNSEMRERMLKNHLLVLTNRRKGRTILMSRASTTASQATESRDTTPFASHSSGEEASRPSPESDDDIYIPIEVPGTEGKEVEEVEVEEEETA